MNRIYILLCIAICLTLTLLLSILIRTPHLSALGETPVLDPDSARYLRQAEIILEQGQLPLMDVLRQYPIGKRSETQLFGVPLHLSCAVQGRDVTFPKYHT